MSIAYQGTSPSICLFACCRIKDACYPLKSKVIAYPSLRSACPIPLCVHFRRDPCFWKILSFKNDRWWNHTSICTNAFNNGNPLASSSLCFVYSLFFCITNNIGILPSYTDIEAWWLVGHLKCVITKFIHIIDILCDNSVCINFLFVLTKPLQNLLLSDFYTCLFNTLCDLRFENWIAP